MPQQTSYKNTKYFIHSIQKGLSVLLAFSPQKPTLTLSELARSRNMNLATARRYLLTLKELGYIGQDLDTRRYRLAPKVLSLGFAALRSMDLRSRVLPTMIKTTKELDVTSQCAILDGTETLYIERTRSSDVVDLNLTTGTRLPAYCTALGKAILAFMDKEEAEKLIDKMELTPLTPYTIKDKQVLRKELELIRQRGYAINDQELALGVRALAVPIFTEDGNVEAALGMSYPYNRTEGNNLEAVFVEKLFEMAKEISLVH